MNVLSANQATHVTTLTQPINLCLWQCGAANHNGQCNYAARPIRLRVERAINTGQLKPKKSFIGTMPL